MAPEEFPFASARLPGYHRFGRGDALAVKPAIREGTMVMNLVVVALIVVFSILIGLALGNKLRRKR